MSAKVLCNLSDLTEIADFVRSTTGYSQKMSFDELKNSLVENAGSGYGSVETCALSIVLDKYINPGFIEDEPGGIIYYSNGQETCTDTWRIGSVFNVAKNSIVAFNGLNGMCNYDGQCNNLFYNVFVSVIEVIGDSVISYTY